MDKKITSSTRDPRNRKPEIQIVDARRSSSTRDPRNKMGDANRRVSSTRTPETRDPPRLPSLPPDVTEMIASLASHPKILGDLREQHAKLQEQHARLQQNHELLQRNITRLPPNSAPNYQKLIDRKGEGVEQVAQQRDQAAKQIEDMETVLHFKKGGTVKKDNTIAILHKGEKVLTAEQVKKMKEKEKKEKKVKKEKKEKNYKK